MLGIRNLKTYFRTSQGVARAVDGVDLYINPGEVVGVVGESGCAKLSFRMETISQDQ